MSTHRASTSGSGGFRAVGQKPPVPYQRAAPDAAPPATVGEQATRAGWAPAGRPSPAHTPPRGQRLPAAGDGRALTVLRIVAYVLTSLASLLFIALVVYGYLVVQDAVDTFPRIFPAGG
ncbi:hypothetical protein LWC35_27480 [Pseudonocardia kujensis]|uniref:hypothetical protein n=1 Tax=Pseudonocardia kujensis TaxID=1128675 RepID=UPI001E2985B8|nr:hypothetical protein [Pseudonocardia kujensis]MCE0766617.1 hypothetical protein [Pseudonocardia kujensis]